MFFLRYSIFPRGDDPERDGVGEGLLNCWIDRPSLAEADKVARRELRQGKWRVLKRETGEAVTEADYDPEDEWLSYYQQALTDKEVFVYHLSPRYPVYWVRAAVEQGQTAENAEAHYFLCGDSIRQGDEDVYDPAFWTGERERAALEGAREAIREGGWTVRSVLEQRPCGRGDLPEELLPFYDEAEESGSCLVFIHEGDPD